jgi:ubiquitin-conjugating enzyme E2 J2
MQKEPPPFVWAAPDEKDILICALTPLSRHDLILIPFTSREFYHRTTVPPAFDAHPRLTHYTLLQHGPPESPYVGGEYHGVLIFPSEYPFKPPGIKVSRMY